MDELEGLEIQLNQMTTDYFIQIDKDSNKAAEIYKVIHLCLIMIFIAHATITESKKELAKHHIEGATSAQLLSDILTLPIPTFALS